MLTFDLPRQQTTPSEKVAGAPLNGSPQTKLGKLGVAMKKPLKFLAGFLERSRSLGKVLSDLWIAVERMECAQVFGHKMPKREPGSLQDDHCLGVGLDA